METTEIIIPLRGVSVRADLQLPMDSLGLVIFAHGSGSGRHSPRNQYVAGVLRKARLGTLLLDLLTEAEEEAETCTRHFRFDIPLLADRLVEVTRWAMKEALPRGLTASFFGASTGAAAALVAAADLGSVVSAVVSRGGRPDLAVDALDRVTAPTLLIVGGNDTSVLPLNEAAYNRLRCPKDLRIVPGASHLFEEPGTLEIVAKMAADWFVDHLSPPSPRS